MGDSGGPLAFYNPIRKYWTQIGVVSATEVLDPDSEHPKCGHPDGPGVYGRVTDLLDWIRSETTGLTCAPPS